jgi:phosphoglucosamine mutase
MAVGTHFASPGEQIVIGCDTRESSAQIVSDLTAGLVAVGVEVVMAGVIPTPGLAYLTREGEQYVAGVMVTASHNPYAHNGIKVFDRSGNKLTDDTEATLNTLIKDGVPEKQPGVSRADETLLQHYEDFLVASAPGLNLDGIRIAIDSANGAASGLAARIFGRLGATVTPLFDKPDGRNINAHCGATDTAALIDRVVADKLSLGIALDGDADRVIMVDSEGREVKGDYLLYILAVTGQCQGVVATVMSNLGFELALKRRDIALKRTDVGDRYVLEGLNQTGYKLGGEQSGHIIFPELLATGDGLLAAVQTLRAIGSSDKNLAQWCDEVNLLPQALVNIPLSNKALLDSPEVQAFIDVQTDQFAGKGRVLIRPSGTEPLARVMVEADDAQSVAQRIAAELEKLLQPSASENHTKLPFPNTYDTDLQPMLAGRMSEAGKQAIGSLEGKGYEVHTGLTPDYADAIAAMANEPSIKEYCPNDSGSRFKNRETTAEWLSKKRATYLLLQKSENGEPLRLAGYGWVGAKHSSQVTGGETTFSLRIGEDHQGKGLASPFAVCMLSAAAATYDTPHMWLETWASNGGAVHIYHKIGFITVAEKPDARPTLGGQTVADTRLFMAQASLTSSL